MNLTQSQMNFILSLSLHKSKCRVKILDSAVRIGGNEQMGILSGFKKFKRYIRVGDDYILDSEWTSSETVQMGDGNTLEQNLGGIKGITDSLDTENSNIAASAKAVNTLKQSVEQNQILLIITIVDILLKQKLLICWVIMQRVHN